MPVDETLQKILTTIAQEHHLGILLAAQLGGTPQEIQLIIQTARMDESHEQLTPLGQFIIRCIGVAEHQLSVGLFANAVHSTQNALLYPHNEPLVQLHFEGQPAQVDSLMIDLNQVYGQTYGMYGPYKRMANELNPTMPLATLLESGQGILGVMPKVFAEKVQRILDRHQMSGTLVEIPADHPPQQHQALVLDDSYIIAQMFSADPMGK